MFKKLFNSGVMPDYFYHDINKVEVILSNFLGIKWDVIPAKKLASKLDCRLQLTRYCT